MTFVDFRRLLSGTGTRTFFFLAGERVTFFTGKTECTPHQRIISGEGREWTQGMR